jgi:hypothetical protein
MNKTIITSKGYLLIDENNIFFSATKNWDVVTQFDQKRAGDLKKLWRKVLLQELLGILFAFIISYLFFDSNQRQLKSLVFGAIVISLFNIYTFYSKNAALGFRIPKSNVLEIQGNGNRIKINYLTASTSAKAEIVNGLNEEEVSWIKNWANS